MKLSHSTLAEEEYDFFLLVACKSGIENSCPSRLWHFFAVVVLPFFMNVNRYISYIGVEFFCDSYKRLRLILH